MQTLSAQDLLELWERGANLEPLQKALLLLAATYPQVAIKELAGRTIGERDADLIALREKLFGPEFIGLANCPQCQQELECKFHSTQIGKWQQDAATPMQVVAGDYQVQFRLPTSLDLSSMATQANGETKLEDVAAILFRACLVEATHQGENIAPDQLPGEVMTAVSKSMAHADPMADVQVETTCPACGHVWFAILDIASFFWKEIDAWSERILHDVHILASAYGWRESEILALSPGRREFYLQMVGV
jgi:hypothetical protein